VSSGEAGYQVRARGPVLGWALLAALFLYACFVHHGVGPPPQSAGAHWYHPRAFLFDCALLAPLLESPVRAMALLGLPALLATGVIAIAGRSAVATALAASCTLATALFLFYGVGAASVWKFFHWRGSVVIVLTALCAGFAASAPLLVESWKRRGWALRLALYLPIFLAVLALMRNATGTDPALRFAISPWPAIPVFGLEVAAAFAALAFAGVALGVGSMALARASRGGAAAAAAGIGLGLGAPALLLWIGSQAGIFPFEAGAASLCGIAAVSGLGIAAVATIRVGEPAADLRRRAGRIATAAALVAAPILAGHALSRHDYTVTRDQQARLIIDALQRYFEREEVYPDSLDELVASADLESVPEPQIGFGLLYAGGFDYQNFGISYILDFPAPRWVQCAYNPPWEDEDEGADGEEEDGDRSLGGAWSCPSAPPELW
jgi:hypothetical protein